MTIANPTLVPELQYWFYNFVVNSVVNKNEVPAPVKIDPIFLPKNSFVEMLFNENYTGTEYKYLYKNETRPQCWPELVRTRLCVYAGSSKYLVPDDMGNNEFNLKTHDFVLLDALLAYRQDSSGLTIVDSTSISFISDSTSAVLFADYDFLNTPLSKLIFLYLDLKIYGRYENYNNLLVVSQETTLETMYELLIIDEYFKFISSRDVDLSIVCDAET